MRSLALFLCICLLSVASGCQHTWSGQGSEGLTPGQRGSDIKSVAALANEYYTQTYFKNVRRRLDGRANAFGRGLDAINATIDRHFFNYSTSDPYVNYESDVTTADHLMRFGFETLVR